MSWQIHIPHRDPSQELDGHALSFGYLVEKSVKRRDGIRELQAVDLYEISVVAAPANPDTRFISLKHAPEPSLVERAFSEALAEQRTLEKADKALTPIRVATFEVE